MLATAVPRLRSTLPIVLIVAVTAASVIGCSSRPSDRSASPGDGSHGALTVHPISDANLIWSPYSWVTDDDARVTPTVGAYVDVYFEGTAIGIEVDTSTLADPGPAQLVVSAQVDDGEPLRRPLSEAVDDRLVWDDLGAGAHHVRLTLAVNDYLRTRWTDAPSSSLRVTGILSPGKLATPPETARDAPTALFYGDSITEGNGIEGLGTLGDNSFAAVAMTELGYRYGLHGYGQLTWQYAIFAYAGSFVDSTSAAYQPHITWMNYFQGRSMLTDGASPRYAEGAPDVILNNLGTNDMETAFESTGYGSPSKDYLPKVIPAWITQVRDVAGPETVIVMVEPIVFSCPEIVAEVKRPKIDAARAAYDEGITAYRDQHPQDRRFTTVDLGDAACEAYRIEAHRGVHPGPRSAQAMGEILADELDAALAAIPG